MTDPSATRSVEHRKSIDRWEDEGGTARPRKRPRSKPLPPNPPTELRSDPTNPLLNPGTSIRHFAEDAAPPQPNELPDPEGKTTGVGADSNHPLGTHDIESSR